MKVPFLDLAASLAELRPGLQAAFDRVLASGSLLLGRELESFEAEWAAYCGAPHAVGLASGLDALVLSLRACDIGPGHEVIVPSNTYIATWLAVKQAGARVVPVEPDPRTLNLDPDRIAAALTSRTRAILPVHLYGRPADLDPVLALAAKHGLRVIEDAAQAHGARYRGRRIGGQGEITAWSFYPTKNLGALGDSGAVTTFDAKVAERLRRLRNYGTRVRYVSEEAGVNSRMEELQAAFLRVKLERLEDWNARRARLAARYLAELPADRLRLPAADGADPVASVWHLFVVRSPRRDGLRKELEADGIGTGVHYPVPPHLQGAFSGEGFREGSFPISEEIHRTGMTLPLHPHLSEAQQARVIEALRARA
jgi:dTDP-4-amino-4,6-dideoxygalactose transaminase